MLSNLYSYIILQLKGISYNNGFFSFVACYNKNKFNRLNKWSHDTPLKFSTDEIMCANITLKNRSIKIIYSFEALNTALTYEFCLFIRQNSKNT